MKLSTTFYRNQASPGYTGGQFSGNFISQFSHKRLCLKENEHGAPGWEGGRYYRGNGGIGRAASRLFAEEGARVALVDLDESALWEVAGSIGEDKASYTVADVTDPEQSQAYI